MWQSQYNGKTLSVATLVYNHPGVQAINNLASQWLLVILIAFKLWIFEYLTEA